MHYRLISQHFLLSVERNADSGMGVGGFFELRYMHANQKYGGGDIDTSIEAVAFKELVKEVLSMYALGAGGR